MIGSKLQWGRDVAVAELTDAAFGLVGKALLQWGRDVAVAELNTAPVAAVGVFGFNGAATSPSRS